jgi:hypothetical protein
MNKLSKVWIFFSIAIALLVSAASLLGIFNPITYSQETANWKTQAIGQDIGNLLAVPVLLISTYLLTKRKSTKAFFIWIGTLLYLIYAYLVYSFSVHFNYLFLVYVAVLGISFYTLIGGLLGQNLSELIKAINNKKMKAASIVLIAIGTLFGFLWLSDIFSALLSGQLPKSIVTAGLWVNPIHIIDLAFVLPGMILTGLFLWRKKKLGYIFAAPWLTFSAIMGSSINAAMILELNNGNKEAMVPLTLVGMIVLFSIFVLCRFLKEFESK